MTTTNKIQTREEWLTDACDHLLETILHPITGKLFKRPNVRVSVGFPKGGRKRIAECYVRAVSKDGMNEIFVTPAIDNSVEILGTLLHELIHATDDCKSGHRGFFRKTALASGLEGKMTATTPTPALVECLTTYTELVGPIPHAALNTSLVKKQGTRMIKIECSNCDFVARTSQKWIDCLDEANTCPCCDELELRVAG